MAGITFKSTNRTSPPPERGDLASGSCFSDAIGKNFLGDSQKLEVTAKSDAVKFTPTFTRDAAGNVSASFGVEGDYVPCKHAKAKLKYGVNDKGILNTKLTVDSMPRAKGVARMSRPSPLDILLIGCILYCLVHIFVCWCAGLKLEVVADLGIGAELSKDKYELKAELKHQKATLVSSVKQVPNKSSKSGRFATLIFHVDVSSLALCLGHEWRSVLCCGGPGGFLLASSVVCFCFVLLSLFFVLFLFCVWNMFRFRTFNFGHKSIAIWPPRRLLEIRSGWRTR